MRHYSTRPRQDRPSISGQRLRHFRDLKYKSTVGPMLLEATTTMTSSIHALILYNWNKHHRGSWHYQEFTHHIFSNQIGVIDGNSTKTMSGRVGSCSGY